MTRCSSIRRFARTGDKRSQPGQPDTFVPDSVNRIAAVAATRHFRPLPRLASSQAPSSLRTNGHLPFQAKGAGHSNRRRRISAPRSVEIPRAARDDTNGAVAGAAGACSRPDAEWRSALRDRRASHGVLRDMPPACRSSNPRGFSPTRIRQNERARMGPLSWRKGWDSNPRYRRIGTPDFESGAFDHSATLPESAASTPFCSFDCLRIGFGITFASLT